MRLGNYRNYDKNAAFILNPVSGQILSNDVAVLNVLPGPAFVLHYFINKEAVGFSVWPSSPCFRHYGNMFVVAVYIPVIR